MRSSPTTIPGAGMLGDDVLVTTPDGRRLRTMVAGPEGETLVVLEAGLGVTGLYWRPVHHLLSKRFRVVAYDRAGVGASDPAPGRRSLEALAADLQAVIDHFPHRQVILVAHSWGGPVVRVAAARRWAAGGIDLAGLVLADQSDEHSPSFFSPGTRVTFGLTAAAMSALAPVAAALPSPRSAFRRALVEATATSQSLRAFAAEMRVVVAELGWLRDHPLDLGGLPVRVLSGQRMGRFDKTIRTKLVGAHRRTAAALAGGRFVATYASGHLIPLTEPELVAAQVCELADQAG